VTHSVQHNRKISLKNLTRLDALDILDLNESTLSHELHKEHNSFTSNSFKRPTWEFNGRSAT